MFVSCEGVDTADGIITALATILRLPEGSNLRLAVFASLSCRGHVLLVLDNLETAWDSPGKREVEQVLARLAEVSCLRLIITMRGAIRPDSIDWVELCIKPVRPLSLDAARQVWRRIARQEDGHIDQQRNGEAETMLNRSIELFGEVGFTRQVEICQHTCRTRCWARCRTRTLVPGYSFCCSVCILLNQYISCSFAFRFTARKVWPARIEQ